MQKHKWTPLSDYEDSRESIADRFWSKVDKSGECWEWTGKRLARYGYGSFYLERRKRVSAHRVAYWLANNHDPSELFVMHRCDNPPCVNPDHLVLGTDLDNIRDCVEKGRNPKHESHGRSVLTYGQVQEIRSRYIPRIVTARMLAGEYGVSLNTIHSILRQETWNDGGDPQSTYELMRWPDYQWILEQLKDKTCKQLALELGATPNSLYAYLHKRRKGIPARFSSEHIAGQ